MTLEVKFQAAMESASKSVNQCTLEELISFIDYTCLETDATAFDIQQLASKADQYHTAAVCVYPQHLDRIPQSAPILRATVVNFPDGDSSLQVVLDLIDDIANHHLVHEIDYVFPYKAYLAGETAYALAHCHSAYMRCKQYGLTFKVILETGAFPSIELIYKLSQEVIQSGCDFLKTSTGKIAIGATLPAAFAILLAMQEQQTSCGIKLSGGIKTVDQAMAFVNLAHHMLQKTPDNTWFRLGASSLLDACISKENDNKSGVTAVPS